MKKMMSVLLACMLIFLLAGCGSDESDSSSPKEITAFSLGTADSPGNFTGTIKGKTIEVTVAYDSDVTSLVAAFTTTGVSVKVGSNIQESGVTSNDFTNPVVYTVTGEDGSQANYTVTVKLAPSSAKAITSFSLGEYTGTIDETGKTIAVNIASQTDVTALVATFATIGKNIRVGAIEQISGTTPNDFTNPVIYTVTAADSTTTTYTVTVTLNLKATSVGASMTPNSPASVPIGVYCTKTTSITGTVNVTDADGGTEVEWKWYDNNYLITSGTATLSEANGTVTTTLTQKFGYHHTIKLEVTADGVVTNSISALVTCGALY